MRIVAFKARKKVKRWRAIHHGQTKSEGAFSLVKEVEADAVGALSLSVADARKCRQTLRILRYDDVTRCTATRTCCITVRCGAQVRRKFAGEPASGVADAILTAAEGGGVGAVTRESLARAFDR